MAQWDVWFTRWGGTIDKGSPYERRFAEAVLTKVPGLEPAHVTPQREFADSRSKRRFMDFAIEDGDILIAVEVDGYDKTGRGRGMSTTEFDDFMLRQSDLASHGWTVLRFTNRQHTNQPTWCADVIGLALERGRIERDRRSLEIRRAQLEGGFQLDTEYREALDDIRRRTEEELSRLRRAQESADAEATSSISAQLAQLQQSLESAPQPAPASPPQAVSATTRTPARPSLHRHRVAIALVVLAVLTAVAILIAVTSGGSGEPGVAPLDRNACPTSHPIKGNINLEGERIFHTSDDAFYDATNPERCFSDESEAEEAGFRASLR